MPETIHFISDLHLSDDAPHLSQLFNHYLTALAKCDALYLLGDIFEVWVGDDDDTSLGREVGEHLAKLVENGTQVFFMAGNRDFLLGNDFAGRYGIKIIDDPRVITLDRQRIALSHGDQLCTDDTEYQAFRKMVRSASWQREFLAAPLAKRKRIAQELRARSKDAQQQKNDSIMDVNADAVSEFIEQLDVDGLIHGHTHRPDRHQFKRADGRPVWRHVLADWGKQGHYLSYSEGVFEDHYFSL